MAACGRNIYIATRIYTQASERRGESIGRIVIGMFGIAMLHYDGIFGNFDPSVALTRSFAPSGNAGQGRFTGTFMINSPRPENPAETFYVVGADTVLFIESDKSAQTSGIMLKQNLTP